MVSLASWDQWSPAPSVTESQAAAGWGWSAEFLLRLGSASDCAPSPTGQTCPLGWMWSLAPSASETHPLKENGTGQRAVPGSSSSVFPGFYMFSQGNHDWVRGSEEFFPRHRPGILSGKGTLAFRRPQPAVLQSERKAKSSEWGCWSSF